MNMLPSPTNQSPLRQIATPYALGYLDGHAGENASRTDPDYVQGFCDGFRARKDEPPCKNEGFIVVGGNGECLRCGADQGEGCRS